MSTYERLKYIVTQKLGKNEDQFFLAANYKNDLGFDSFELVILMCQVEETFGIEILDEEINGVITVASTIELIGKHSQKNV